MASMHTLPNVRALCSHFRTGEHFYCKDEDNALCWRALSLFVIHLSNSFMIQSIKFNISTGNITLPPSHGNRRIILEFLVP